MFHLFTKSRVDGIINALTAVGGKTLGVVDDGVPLVRSKAPLDVAAGDAVTNQSVNKPGIEIVTGANGTDSRMLRQDGILASEPVIGTYQGGLTAPCIDELLGIEGDFGAIDGVGILLVIHNAEILVGSANDIGQFQILQDIGRQLHDFMLMGSPVVDIVVEYGAVLLGILQEAFHLRTYHGIDSKIGTEEYHIVLVNLGIDKFQLVVGMVLVEDIVSIVVLVEKRQ